MHAREQQIRAHAQFIVLTENAVGFENGGQCVPSNRETYPLYVSKATAEKQLNRFLPKALFARAPIRGFISCIPQLLCVLQTWCFSWLCDYLTLHSKQRLHANDINPNVGNTGVFNHLIDKPVLNGIVNSCFTDLRKCFE